jgi:hypothetical protein
MRIPSMTVTAHVLRDVHLTPADRDRLGRYLFDDFQNDRALRQRWISFVCLAYNPTNGLLYCGLTAYDSDVLYTFDAESGRFRSLGFPAVADRFDVKVHRSLEIDEEGVVFGATACLHGYDQRGAALGGKIFRYDPRHREIEILETPQPHEYIQTIAMDRRRNLIYGYTYHVPHLSCFDLSTGQAKDLGVVGRDAHSLVIDDQGHLWGTWLQMYGVGTGQPARTNLLEYDPDGDELTWHTRSSLPPLHAADTGYVDSIVNGGDGWIYVGTTAGALLRFAPLSHDPASGGGPVVEYLGRPLRRDRLPGLVVGQDGLIYGCGGCEGDARLFSYDRQNRRCTDLGRIVDGQRGVSCRLTHGLSEVGAGRFYVAETDNLDRSGYLWECAVSL